jgi:hypothetical protein
LVTHQVTETPKAQAIAVTWRRGSTIAHEAVKPTMRRARSSKTAFRSAATSSLMPVTVAPARRLRISLLSRAGESVQSPLAFYRRQNTAPDARIATQWASMS